MKGKYITPNGDTVKVDSFDEENKLVSVHLGSGQYKHFIEKEYSEWESVNSFEEIVERLPEEIVMETKVSKPKSTKKK